MNEIYLDNAATTKPSQEVILAMMPYLTENYGNPSSLYAIGIENRNAVEKARNNVANVINANPSEIYFTSGGSESDNWVLKSLQPGDHVITSVIEHHAITHTCEWLKKHGVEVTYVPVDKQGFVDPIEIETSIQSNTKLISIMFANNEIGTIQKIREIGDIAKSHDVLFHTDAVQAFGHVPIDVKKMGIDFLSCSAHKLNGPKGVGALYIRDGIIIDPLIHGGGQESGMRAGTENVPGIVGFGRAAELALVKMEAAEKHNRHLCEIFINGMSEAILNGADIGENRLSNNLNVTIPGIRGEELAALLNDCGYYVSTGSACNSSNNEPSHVLKAIGLSDDDANCSIRITVSSDISELNIYDFVSTLRWCMEVLQSRE